MFKPTYLYIKQHQVSGLMYLGITTGDVEKYKGSGKIWLRHIKKYGKDKIDTNMENYRKCYLSALW